MFEMPDWYRAYASKDAWGNATGGNFSPASALSTGLPNAAPIAAPAAAPAPDPNAAARAAAMSGVVDPAASGGFTQTPSVGPDTGGFQIPPMPPRRPQNPGAGPSVAPPMPTPRPGGNWGTTTALEGDPALPDWATPGSQSAATSEDRQIGPGSWMDPSKLGKLIDPHSLVGKLLAMRNTSSAPKPVGQPEEQGLLSGLFAQGGLFGNDPTTPNSTTGGLW